MSDPYTQTPADVRAEINASRASVEAKAHALASLDAYIAGRIACPECEHEGPHTPVMAFGSWEMDCSECGHSWEPEGVGLAARTRDLGVEA